MRGGPGSVGPRRRHQPAIPARRRLPGEVTGSGVPGTDPDDLTEDGHNFLDRYAELGDLADLRRARAAYERALAVLPPGEPTWPFLSNLGNCLRMVHEESGDTQALNQAVHTMQDALSHVGAGTEDYALVADNLALALRDAAAATGAPGSLQRAVDLHQAAVAAYGDGPELARYRGNLGGVLWERYRQSGDLASLKQATQSIEQAVAATPPRSPERARWLSNLAMVLGDLFRAGHDTGLLTEAIDAGRAALGVPGSDVTDRGRVLSSLADLLMERFDAEGDTGDLDEAVALLRQAVAGTRPGSPRHTLWLGNLADALLARFEAEGTGSDLDEAVEIAERAVREASRTWEVSDTQAEGILESGLGSALGARYAARGDEADLDRAIALVTSAVARIPAGSEAAAFASSRRNNLAALLRRRYEARGDPADLEAAARCLHEQDCAGPRPRTGIARQAGLARAWRDMHAVTGDARLLNDAISGYQHALAATGPKAPVRATYLDNLGMALLDRYERSGAIDDADEAVRLLRLAREATPRCSPALAGVLNNLGVALWSRSAHRPADLPEALAAFGQAVAITPARSPDAPTYLDNLANALSDRYERSGDPADLDEAVHAYERAIGRLPARAPERLRIRANLAVGLLTRYREAGARETGGAADLERAVAELTDVVARTPPGAPALVNRLNSLGVGLKYKFLRDNDPACLQQGRAALATASGPGGARDIRWSLAAAATLAGWDAERAQWQEAAAGFRTAMATAESYLYVQVGRQSTEAAMRGFGGLHGDAAYALARTGKPAEAAAAMERGRAVLLSDALDRELVLTRLRSAGREDLSALAERLRGASNRVQELTAGTSADTGEAQARSARG
jgi:tetratricopeptide (TPR) repeat protein